MPEIKTNWKRTPKTSKFDRARVNRNKNRKKKGKKPLAMPLEIASKAEREKALKEGKMVFLDGEKRIELPLVSKFDYGIMTNAFLQGVYKTPKGKIIALRSFSSFGIKCIVLFSVSKGKNSYAEKVIKTSIFSGKHYMDNKSNFKRVNLPHMKIPRRLRKIGLGLKAVSKTEREQRALNEGKYGFLMNKHSPFSGLFEKLGYKLDYESFRGFISAQKKGKHQPKDDLNKFHRIEAIDPKTGKAKIFTFKIQN